MNREEAGELKEMHEALEVMKSGMDLMSQDLAKFRLLQESYIKDHTAKLEALAVEVRSVNLNLADHDSNTRGGDEVLWNSFIWNKLRVLKDDVGAWVRKRFLHDPPTGSEVPSQPEVK